MFCSECGKQVADNAKFCGECGAAQTASISDATQTCPSCNAKGWEHGKQCRSCGYTDGKEVTAIRNNSQAPLTKTSSSGNSNVIRYIVGAIVLVGLSYFIDKHLSSYKTGTTEIVQNNQVASVTDLDPQTATHAFGVCMAYHTAVKKDGIAELNTAPILATGKIMANTQDEGVDWINRYFMLGGNEEAKKVILDEAEKSCKLLNLPY